MAKVLLLGADGLLGSCLEQALINVQGLELVVTTRNLSKDHDFTYSVKGLNRLVAEVHPNYIINCIAVTSAKRSILDMLKANTFLPIQLAYIGFLRNIKVIHFSTNAVFSGFHSSNYEKSLPTPRTKYGFTKLLGDLSMFGNLVLRTSFVGDSPRNAVTSGLVFSLRKLDSGAIFEISENYYWNGVTTDALCELVVVILKNDSFPRGLLHLSSKNKIQRCDLIRELLKVLGRDDVQVSVRPSNRVRNLSLDSTKYELISSIWADSSYLEIPEFTVLAQQMKIY